MVCALGLEDELVAITHECDFPPSVRARPVVTSSALKAGELSHQIDRHIGRLVHEGSSIYQLDATRLAELRPDLILTQELCEVCAVSYPIVESAARRLDASTQLISLEPESLGDVFEHLRLLGRLTGRAGEADRVVSALQDRVASVVRAVGGASPRRVLCLEWIDPLFGSGHWTPELVQLAGGQALLARPCEPARTIAWQEVLAAAPKVIVVMACGFSLARSLEEMPLLARRPGWAELPAIRSGHVYVVDGNAYFSRPGPRLVDSLEIMAGLLHPDRVDPPAASRAQRWSGS